jgi:hypothetical protein
MHDRPQARIEDIVAEWVDDDLVIYDQLSQTAHSLSAAVANVWEVCDGQHSADEIARQLSLEPAMVARALEQLSECALLDDGSAIVPGISRRAAAKKFAKVGGLAFSAPLIYSVAIGPATAAASGGGCATTGTHANGTQYGPGTGGDPCAGVAGGDSGAAGCATTCGGSTPAAAGTFGFNSNCCSSGACYVLTGANGSDFNCVAPGDTCKTSQQACTTVSQCCATGGSCNGGVCSN